MELPDGLHQGDDIDLEECPICYGPLHPPSDVKIDGSYYCEGCIRRLFERAIRSEEDHPPKVGSHILQLGACWLPPNLRTAFRERGREYAVPPDDRIYCQDCEKFIASTTESLGKRLQSPGLEGAKHICKDKDDQDAFAGMVQGRDYQICPKCKRKVELLDGCNHLVCHCSQEFCFVCGEPADGGSGHWTEGLSNCPRYNQPDSRNAIYDDFYDDDDPDDDPPPPALLAERQRRNAMTVLPTAVDVNTLQRLTTANANAGREQRAEREWRAERVETIQGIKADRLQREAVGGGLREDSSDSEPNSGDSPALRRLGIAPGRGPRAQSRRRSPLPASIDRNRLARKGRGEESADTPRLFRRFRGPQGEREATGSGPVNGLPALDRTEQSYISPAGLRNGYYGIREHLRAPGPAFPTNFQHPSPESRQRGTPSGASLGTRARAAHMATRAEMAARAQREDHGSHTVNQVRSRRPTQHGGGDTFATTAAQDSGLPANTLRPSAALPAFPDVLTPHGQSNLLSTFDDEWRQIQQEVVEPRDRMEFASRADHRSHRTIGEVGFAQRPADAGRETSTAELTYGGPPENTRRAENASSRSTRRMTTLYPDVSSANGDSANGDSANGDEEMAASMGSLNGHGHRHAAFPPNLQAARTEGRQRDYRREQERVEQHEEALGALERMSEAAGQDSAGGLAEEDMYDDMDGQMDFKVGG